MNSPTKAMDLTRDPLPGLMRQIAIPGATGLFLQTLLNLTDTWFAGQLSTLAQAALSLSFPLFFVVGTFGAGLATGGSALVGRALGAGDPAQARSLAGQALFLGFGLGAALMFIGPALARPAFISMGAVPGEYLDLCLSYQNIIFYASPFFILAHIVNALLVVQGDSRGLRNALAASVAINAFLDWWFITGGWGLPPLGVAGLALATALVQIGAFIYLSRRLAKTGLFAEGFAMALRPRLALQKELWRQALPPGLNQASVGLGIYVINWFVGKFGAEAIAAYGVAVRLEQMVLLPALGLSMAMLPLAAQNDGAGRFDRAVTARRLAVTMGVKISMAAFVILVFGGRFLMSLITPDEAVQAEGAWFLTFDASIFFAYVLLYINVAFLQGLKRPMFALWMGLYRQIAAPVIVFWLLAFVFDLRTTGIWLGIALVTASGALISEIYTRRVIRNRCRAECPPSLKLW